MKSNVSERRFLKFAENVSKLSEVEFLGLTRILCVPLCDENNEPRDFYEILSDVLDKFLTINRKTRKEVEEIVAAAVKKEKKKKEAVHNGTSTKNPAKE